jgi:H+/gluconate symporter-like permease
MSLVIVLAALVFLMLAAYRGYSVILFAPVAALGAVLLTDPALVAPMFTGLFMERMTGFLKLYLPVFLLGAVFGKVVEQSGFSKSIVSSVINLVGRKHAIFSTVAVCALLTYGGVSLFVVVFAVYPIAAEIFLSDIQKRLSYTIALGAFTFDGFAARHAADQNIIRFLFRTNIYAAPRLGSIGAVFILVTGLIYLHWRCRCATAAGEGYGADALQEPEPFAGGQLANPFIAILPLILVGVMNKVFTVAIPKLYGEAHSFIPTVVGLAAPVTQEISKVAAIWAVEGALLAGILTVLVFAWKPVVAKFAEGSKSAIAGALLASANTASEYGFGAVIAALPGFLVVADVLKAISHPLINEAITVTSLAGITGSASGGLSIALAAMAETFLQNAHAAGIPPEVLHRVASMASGGMDTLPHNGAVITLFTVTGLTHRQSYGDIFVITCLKTTAVFVVIAVYHLTGLV